MDSKIKRKIKSRSQRAVQNTSQNLNMVRDYKTGTYYLIAKYR